MQNYGKQIKWSTIDAPNPAGGICEDYSYEDGGSEDDYAEFQASSGQMLPARS